MHIVKSTSHALPASLTFSEENIGFLLIRFEKSVLSATPDGLTQHVQIPSKRSMSIKFIQLPRT